MEGAAVAQNFPLPSEGYLRGELHRLEEGFRAFQDSIADEQRQGQGTDCVCALAAGHHPNHHPNHNHNNNNNSNNPELDSGDASNAGLRAALDRLTSRATAMLAEQEGCPCAARAGGVAVVTGAVAGTKGVTGTATGNVAGTDIGTLHLVGVAPGTVATTGTDVGTLNLIGAPPGTENTQVDNTQVEDTATQNTQTGWTGPKGGDNNLFASLSSSTGGQLQSSGVSNPNNTMEFSTPVKTGAQNTQTGWTEPKGGDNNLFESLSRGTGRQLRSSGISNPIDAMDFSSTFDTPDVQNNQTGWTIQEGNNSLLKSLSSSTGGQFQSSGVSNPDDAMDFPSIFDITDVQQNKQTGWTVPKGGDNNLFETVFGNSVEGQFRTSGTTNPEDIMDISDFEVIGG